MTRKTRNDHIFCFCRGYGANAAKLVSHDINNPPGHFVDSFSKHLNYCLFTVPLNMCPPGAHQLTSIHLLSKGPRTQCRASALHAACGLEAGSPAALLCWAGCLPRRADGRAHTGRTGRRAILAPPGDGATAPRRPSHSYLNAS